LDPGFGLRTLLPTANRIPKFKQRLAAGRNSKASMAAPRLAGGGLAWAACTSMSSIGPWTQCRKPVPWAFHALRRFAQAILKDGERRARGPLRARDRQGSYALLQSARAAAQVSTKVAPTDRA